jgi:hypothetical protein
MSKHLDMWFEGWRRGDAEMVLGAVTDDFVYDDPIDGRMAKGEFGAYLAELLSSDDESSSETANEGFEAISDVVVQEKDGEETAWGWWKAPPQRGSDW